jgi:hypothetical protein
VAGADFIRYVELYQFFYDGHCSLLVPPVFYSGILYISVWGNSYKKFGVFLRNFEKKSRNSLARHCPTGDSLTGISFTLPGRLDFFK